MIKENTRIPGQQGLEYDGGTVTVRPTKFHPQFKEKSNTYMAIADNGTILAVQKDGGGWAIINAAGKVLKTATSLPNERNTVYDAIYIKRDNAFYIYEDDLEEIWRIGVEDLEITRWRRGIESAGYCGRHLKAALKGEPMIITKISNTRIHIFSEASGSSQTDLSMKFLEQFEIGGKNRNIMIALDSGRNKIVKIGVRGDLEVTIIAKFDFSRKIGKEDWAWSIAITPDAKYVLVSTYNNLTDKTTKQLMISIQGKNMKICAILDLTSQNLDRIFEAFVYLKTIGDQLIFKAITSTDSPLSTVLTIIYNTKTRKLKELKKHRKVVKDHRYFSLKKLGDTLYSIGHDKCRILTLT